MIIGHDFNLTKVWPRISKPFLKRRSKLAKLNHTESWNAEGLCKLNQRRWPQK